MNFLKDWALTAALGIAATGAAFVAIAPVQAIGTKCYMCFMSNSGGSWVSGCRNGYASGGTGCTVSGSSCSITGQCGV